MVRSCWGRAVPLPDSCPELPGYRGSRDLSVSSRARAFGGRAAMMDGLWAVLGTVLKGLDKDLQVDATWDLGAGTEVG